MDYCIKCSTPLKNYCSRCGTENSTKAKFCGNCAAPLRAEGALPRAGVDHLPERRQLTVMFCDLVGSTHLSDQLDPEELRDVMIAYQECCTGIVREMDGYVAQYLGDGILTYFGFPHAHEDDGVRAISAALSILNELPLLSARIGSRIQGMGHEQLQARVGIHTGPVVVGEMGSGSKRELLALGEAVNLTARLLDEAQPNWIVISASTWKLVEGVFVSEDLGERSLRGIGRLIRLHRILRPSGVRRRLDLVPATQLTPFVGRQAEIARLDRLWQKVKSEVGGAIQVCGEPGIGKSRLLKEFQERLEVDPHTWLEATCSSYHQSSAFYPIIELVEKTMGFTQDDLTDSRIEKLERGLEASRMTAPEDMALFCELLSLPLPEGHAPPSPSAEVRRRKTLDALVRWILRQTEEAPVALVVEDLHWVDPSTEELLGLILMKIMGFRLFIFLTFRPGFDSPWEGTASLEDLTLEPLTDEEVSQMARGVAGGKSLPREVVTHVIAKSDGVPFVIEEFTKTLLESNLLTEEKDRFERTDPLPELAIPTTLQDSLMARLDRLGAIKDVAQLASVLGREFSTNVLRAVSSLDKAFLEQALEKLVQAGLLLRKGAPPRAIYAFKHALIQDTAYQSQLKSRRRETHYRIAETLEQDFPEMATTQPELLAWHFEQAERYPEAISYYRQASARTMARSASHETISHLTRGIELISHLADTAERDERELEFQSALGNTLLAARGFGNPEVERVLLRAYNLAEALGKPPQLHAGGGLFLYYQARVQMKSAAAMAEQILRSGDQSGEPFLIAWGHTFSGIAHYYQAQNYEAISHLKKAIAAGAPSSPQREWYLNEHEPAMASRCHAALVLWHVGKLDLSLQLVEEAVEIGEKSDHPVNLTFALSYATMLHYMRHEYERALQRAEKLIPVAKEQGFPLWLGLGMVFRGWAHAHLKDPTEGLDLIQRGLGESAKARTRVEGPRFLELLAGVYHAIGEDDTALGTLESGITMSALHGNVYWDAEMHRVKGDILLTRGGSEKEKGEESIRRAVKIAQAQKARALELRAAISLSRHLQGEGKTAEARETLVNIYDQLDEGQDTPDMIEATALLEQLD